MAGSSQDLNLSFGSGSFGFSGSQSDFWKDVPDNILNELRSDLEQSSSYTRSFSFQSTEFWSDFSIQQPNTGFSSWGLETNSQDDKTKLRESLGTSLAQLPVGVDPAVALPQIKLEKGIKQEISPLKMEADQQMEDDEPPPPPPPVETPSIAPPLLKEISKQQLQQEKQLEEIVKLQRGVTISHRDEFAQLQQKLFKLHQQITQELKELEGVLKKEILPPALLATTQTLIQLLQIQQQKTDILKTELQHIANEDKKCVVALAIIGQPGPSVVFKGRAMEKEAVFSVKLLTGAKVDLAKIGTVKTVISDEEEWKSNKPLSNETAEFNVIENKASIKELKVNISTRMTPIQLRFLCTLRDKNVPEEIVAKSTLTTPIIVITNESQWGEAAGKLVLADAFPTQGTVSIPWCQYVNTLHSHLLRATNQDPMKPNRGFTQQELLYIQDRFFEHKTKVTQKEAETCWSWLGAVLTTIRFKRHIRPLWWDGIIYGLASKKDCNRILKKEETGTFLIRFSDSSAGSFAVAYATDDKSQKVKHYLIKPEEIGANKSLPEFLREKKMFRKLVRLETTTGNSVVLDKNIAFHNFYKEAGKKGKKEPEPDTHGYVQNLDTES